MPQEAEPLTALVLIGLAFAPIVVLYVLMLSHSSQSNLEEWEIIRDNEGRLVNVRVHRKVT